MAISVHPHFARLRIQSWESGDKSVDVSGELHLDRSLHAFAERIEIYGAEDESLRLMSFVGKLVQISELTPEDARTRSFVGRVGSVGGFGRPKSDLVRKIATIHVEKSVEEYERGSNDPQRHCSYTYATDVTGWPVTGGFGFSYEGTIELHKYEGGLHVLLKNDDVELIAAPNYFFRDDDKKVVRQRLVSIQLQWTRAGLDYKRLLDSAHLVLSFMYTVKLRPLSKTYAADGKLRIVTWSPSNLMSAERDSQSVPISISDQEAFQSKAIETLFSSDHSVDLLNGAIDRYIECRTDVTIERSFAHGCEAIEGLYTLLSKQLPPTKTATYPKVRKKLKELVEHEIKNDDDRATASSKIDQLFNRPTWRRIEGLIVALASGKGDLIHQVLARASFFKYRNLSSHGQVVRLDNEVVLQSDLMRFVIEWMFIKLCGGTATPQTARQIRPQLNQSEAPELGIIQLWE